MQFRPCIDLHNGKVKQIVGSSLSDANNSATVNFESDRSPAEFAQLYRQHNLKGGHLIKLGPGNEAAAETALSAWPCGLQIGGGITADNAAEYLAMGASHVIVTSYVFNNGKVDRENLEKLASVVGPDRLVLDLSCKVYDGEYRIVTDRWQTVTDTVVSEDTLADLGTYCNELLVHAASVEGMMAGPDLNLVSLLADYSPVPVTYAGGISTMDDIDSVSKAGKNKVHITIGSALDLFGGSLSFDQVVERCQVKKTADNSS